MQFRISTGVGNIDPGAVQDAVHAVDPAAMVDLVDATDQLRVSTFMSVFELIQAMDQSGYLVTREQIFPVKSECCGGCGG